MNNHSRSNDRRYSQFHQLPSQHHPPYNRSNYTVPRFEASIILSQKSGSAESAETIPYRGTCERTRNISRVTAVHVTRCWKGTLVEQVSIVYLRMGETWRTFLSGEMISGSHFWNGLTRSRNRTKRINCEIIEDYTRHGDGREFNGQSEEEDWKKSW